MAGGQVPVRLIADMNPAYLRTDVGDVTDLARDMKKRGLVAPILLSSDYVILDGARRFEAAKALGWTEIWAIAAGGWHVIRAELLASVERHQAPRSFVKPKTFLDIIELQNALSPIIRSTMHLYAKPKNDPGPKRSMEQSRVEGVAGTLETVVGMTRARIKELSAISKHLFAARERGDKQSETAIIELLERAERGEFGLYQLSRLIPIRIRQNWEEPLGPTPLPTKEQTDRFDRAMVLIKGAIAALPEPSTLSPELDPDAIARWTRDFITLTTFAARTRRRFREITTEKNEGQS